MSTLIHFERAAVPLWLRHGVWFAFVAAVAFASGGKILFETTGVVNGTIAPQPRGTEGFGYDPIFFYPPLGRTLAEVDGAAKAAVSHRGAAFRNFREYLLRSHRS